MSQRHAPIPPLRPAHEMPPVVDQASLDHTLRALVGIPGFATPQVWLLEVVDRHVGQIIIIDHAPLVPVLDDIEPLGEIAGALAADGGSCALLYARPGAAVRTPGDIAWARGLASIGTAWPIHLANDEEVRVVAPDDLA